MSTCNYIIVNITELNNVDYSQVLQTSADTVRKNIEETKFILKYDCDNLPSTVQSLDDGGKLFTYSEKKHFTHSEILNIISDVEWVGTQSFI